MARIVGFPRAHCEHTHKICTGAVISGRRFAVQPKASRGFDSSTAHSLRVEAVFKRLDSPIEQRCISAAEIVHALRWRALKATLIVIAAPVLLAVVIASITEINLQAPGRRSPLDDRRASAGRSIASPPVVARSDRPVFYAGEAK